MNMGNRARELSGERHWLRKPRGEMPASCPAGARWIPLTRGQFALVDEEDYELVNKSSWSAECRGRTSYAVGKRGGRTICLHRMVLNAPDGSDVDHINGDGLDCRRSNLRCSTHQENCFNARKRSSPTSSQYKGVSWHRRSGKWSAQICVHGSKVHLGLYATEIDAAEAYDAAAVLHFGEFARLNLSEAS